MNLEREAKLQVPDTLVLPALDDVAPGIVATERAPVETATTYVDTKDLRLARWGWSLRHREGEEQGDGHGDGHGSSWTLKVPESSSGEVLVRSEHRFEGAADVVPAEALDLATAVTRSEPVEPVAMLRTTRRVVALSSEGSVIAEVMDDRVRVDRSPAGPSTFREVEVEMLEDRPDVLDAVMRRLDAAGAPKGPAPSKYDRALGGRPEPELPDEALDAATVRDVVRTSLSSSVARLVVNDPGVRLGEDPEAVHQARVAVRRLRSDLRTFRPWLSEAWADELRESLRWLGQALGGVRDSDVLIDRLRRRVASLPAADRDAGAEIVAKLVSLREERRSELLAAMRDQPYVALLDRLVSAAREPVVGEDRASPAPDVAAVMQPVWRRLAQTASSLGRQPSDAELHAVRIRTKRARYAAEALAPVAGKAARRFADRAAELQDVLGEHQDAVVAEDWLRRSIGRGRRASFVAGELVAAERAAAEAAAAAWPAAWDTLDRKRIRFW